MREEVKRNRRRLFEAYSYHCLELIPQITRCKLCKKKFLRIDHRFNNAPQSLWKVVNRDSICYECAYWVNLIENPPDGLQITDGKCYKVLPFIEEPAIYMTLGGNGKTRYYITNDYKLIKSNDVWRLGEIPQRFREQLPNTGWFCSKKVFDKLTNFNGRCNEKGCFDRYKCIRFKTEIELKEGAFNSLLPGWNFGDEHCRSFISTDELENYISPIKPKYGTKKEND